MQLHCVVIDTVTTESSSEEVRRGILKIRDATLLTLAVFLVVAIAAASSSPVSAQYAPCPPGYSYGGTSCYPGYNNPYPYNGQNNPYNNCQTGYYSQNNGCYYPSYNNPYSSRFPYYPYNNPYKYPYYNPYNSYSPYKPYYNCQSGYSPGNSYGYSQGNYYGNSCYYSGNYYRYPSYHWQK